MNNAHARLVPGKRDHDYSIREVKRVTGIETDCMKRAPSLSSSFPDCPRISRHEKFIPLPSLRPEDLPRPFSDDRRWRDMIRARAADTVKLTVHHTSPSRPEPFQCRSDSGSSLVRTGTGTAFWSGLTSMRCPLPDCKVKGDHEVYGPFRVVTVAHLVFNAEEARQTKIEFFDDDPIDKSSVCCAEVTELKQGSEESNRAILACVTHDSRIPERLEQAWKERNDLLQQLQEPAGANMCVLISHPHGVSKHISFGEVLDVHEYGQEKTTRDCKLRLRDCRLDYSTPSCLGSGGGSITMWKRGRRAFAPHCRTLGETRSQSALGWISVPQNTENGSI